MLVTKVNDQHFTVNNDHLLFAGSLTTQFPLEAQPEVFKEAALSSSHFEWRIMVLPQF